MMFYGSFKKQYLQTGPPNTADGDPPRRWAANSKSFKQKKEYENIS
jgi:hypothetical protein